MGGEVGGEGGGGSYGSDNEVLNVWKEVEMFMTCVYPKRTHVDS